ncbi:PQQ-dependent sugar dehydrogenase [Clavibacter zhangzhiyongii]|uniref:PQQ-dependent sugar dehydrogenase n=1 Tax=Clavibacter zhangzhiyongii TaxID=2768071 RepID=A0A7L7Z1H8_9MICO|nr:PQQ-dependent sugar dehydrogenase [Clavibacter zhangzhiyongii]MBM7024348.1 PQQ-dependent sugar dehydrogenase [Clavibacter zhangzhiyongii]QOD43511.1 PQQ-dependent sugar dehydrogenase [Clavibacter zhangzhiyongii]
MNRRSRTRPARLAALGLAALVALTGCTNDDGSPVDVRATEPPAPSAEASDAAPAGVAPSGTPTAITTGLVSPWSIAELPSGSLLVSERDTARVVEVLADGTTRVAGVVAGVGPLGEGGLLGIAPREADGTTQLYAYLTSDTDNRIVRMDVTGEAGSLGLGPAEDVVTGIPRDANHNGGRIAFGPDGMLYATTGDADLRDAAQDPISLAGKILRLTPEGQGPADNPTPGSPVYSLGHRNPQGLAWDAEGNLWSAEFGQDTWDELNLIEPGGNYGWPVVEGSGDDPSDAYIDPVRQWATDDASPSGIAVAGDTIFMAGLGGQRLWVIRPGAVPTDPIPDDRVTEFYTREFGRIRDVQAAPDGSLRMLTNNTDGRGQPREGDDKLLRVELMPIQAG